MIAFRDLLAEGLLLRRQRYVDLAKTAVSPRVQTEMTDGFLAMMTEALLNQGTTARSFYFGTVVPSVLRSGDPDDVADALVTWTVDVIDDIISWAPSRTRQETVMWLATFFAGHVTDLEAARRASGSRMRVLSA
jgi:hypothetical protein